MNKAELIRRVAKNVGVPDTDAKIFFELFLKRISALLEIGQSIFVIDFGYFHLIKGSIKKPINSFKNNEISEEAVEFVLYSEDKDLRNSDTKGLVFNIPIFDEEDYHPIDSAFSLSIGKPLIPLRGVPFNNIYMPTSGFEYRRLIESKVEKIISASVVAESEENFPILVIDASSYNSNQVQLKWDDKLKVDTADKKTGESELEKEVEPKLSEYEQEAKELTNIAWDFGEDLSKQIEVESILDIADERINMDSITKMESNILEDTPEVENKVEELPLIQNELSSEQNLPDTSESLEEVTLDQTSEKLNELLESENEPDEKYVEGILEKSIDEKYEDDIEEMKTEVRSEKNIEDEKLELTESSSPEDEISDEEFWKSTSKYFEPFKPGAEKKYKKEFEEVKSNFDNLDAIDSKEFGQKIVDEIRDEDLSDVIKDADSILEESAAEIDNANQEYTVDESKEEHKIELEIVEEPKAEYVEPDKKKNLVPFLIFPLLVIGLSLLLYWYLEFYKKSEVSPKPTQIALKSNNAKIVQRNFDIPVTYPYLPKVKETSISEPVSVKKEDQSLADNKNVVENQPEISDVKKVEKEIPKQKVTEYKKPVIPANKSLNVGNNIYKYGNYFVVQVAAFRSSSISENEAGKYRNKGYNAFVEAAEIPGRGTWYRVRVGNFNSKEEAQIFSNKNVR